MFKTRFAAAKCAGGVGSEARKFMKMSAWCKSKSRKRRERRTKKNQHRRAEQERYNTLGGMFWNARGIVDKVDEVIAYMEVKNLAFCMVSESRNCGRNLSRGKKWRWLAGSECLPEIGCLTPPKGIGALINTELLPGASIVKCTMLYGYVLQVLSLTCTYVVCISLVDLHSLESKH
jgi:hypothetical protein